MCNCKKCKCSKNECFKGWGVCLCRLKGFVFDCFVFDCFVFDASRLITLCLMLRV